MTGASVVTITGCASMSWWDAFTVVLWGLSVVIAVIAFVCLVVFVVALLFECALWIMERDDA